MDVKNRRDALRKFHNRSLLARRRRHRVRVVSVKKKKKKNSSTAAFLSRIVDDSDAASMIPLIVSAFYSANSGGR